MARNECTICRRAQGACTCEPGAGSCMWCDAPAVPEPRRGGLRRTCERHNLDGSERRVAHAGTHDRAAYDAWYRSVPAHKARALLVNGERARERYASDPEYRERVLARARTPAARSRQNAARRERRATDPEYRERERAGARERYASNPEYRERVLASARTPAARARRNARRRERYASDPEYRERVLAGKRARRARREAARAGSIGLSD